MSGNIPRLYLIDGSSYVYRAFFALPPLTAPDGLPINAVYGVTTMLLKLLNEVTPQYLGVVFDAPGKTFRDEQFAAYKANREAAPPELTAQMDLVHRVVAEFRIPVLCIPGVEADDVIATVTDRLAVHDVECVIITGDKDLMQLVGPRVRLWDTMRDRWIDEAAVEAKFGVPPARVVDVMALMGDAVDNIPGVKGIGEKTATALIREFGDLEGVLSHLPEVERMKLRGAKTIAGRLRAGADVARLSRALAKAKRDVSIECSLETFRLPGPDTDALRALFTRLGFHSLVRQLSARVPALTVSARVVRDAADLRQVSAAFRSDGWLALAARTDAGPAVTTPARTLVLSGRQGPPLLVPLEDADLQREVVELLANLDLEIVTHDLKRDLLALAARGVSVRGVGFDVMIASYLLDAAGTNRIEQLAADVLGAHLEGFRDTDDATAAGVALLGPLHEHFGKQLREHDLERLFLDVEMPLTRVLAQMERRGILIDGPRLRRIGQEFAERLETLMRNIHELAGEEFNINSSSQLRAVLFQRLHLPTRGVRKGKTGYSTDVEVLNRLAQTHPLPAKILEYRALAKLKSTYVDALPAAVNPVTGRLHTTFNQTVTATGRLSSSDPNLQNIPIRGEEGRRIRDAFIAPPGHVLLAADYSQIELRILAHLSGDPALVEAFRTNQDVHARTAAEVFGVLPGMVTADMRRAAKVINFGIIYGMGPQRLAHELGISVNEAQRYIERYFSRYTGVRAYLQSVIAQARDHGHVTTMLGRRRAIPQIHGADRATTQAAERVATNTPIQGSAADLIKMAMVGVEGRIQRERLRAALLLQVHDELLLEVAAVDLDAARAAVREEMEGVMVLTVPLRVDLGVGATWAEAH